MIIKNNILTVGGIISLLLLVTPLWADQFVIDQNNEFDGSGLVPFYTLVHNNSIGQEFRPTLSSLNFVDLLTNHDNPNASIQVVIRRDSFAGTIVGTSQLMVFTNVIPSIKTNRFYFPTDVPLIPGSNYVLQAVTFGGNIWGIGAIYSNPYPLGRMINNGQPDSDKDLWFREGVIVPAPDAAQISIRLSHVEVCWASQTNKLYQVQYRSEQTTNIWTNIGAPSSGNGTTNCLTDSIGISSRVYRILPLP